MREHEIRRDADGQVGWWRAIGRCPEYEHGVRPGLDERQPPAGEVDVLATNLRPAVLDGAVHRRLVLPGAAPDLNRAPHLPVRVLGRGVRVVEATDQREALRPSCP
ncbi:hypothetical protein AB0J84_02625 [Micromonospora arborensis]|uniref:hypothetical protein n=1 Tax=Micromonospora arborensis TaxID=2116518 RepID=UPI0034378A74